jgi:hypothetical protein
MERDHFIKILGLIHFSDNLESNSEDRLSKVRNALNLLVNSFRSTLRPGKEVVIDESMVPWRGRLFFRQYIPGKSHKYGIKLYKCCLTGGYTYNFQVYSGKDTVENQKGHSHDVVMKLMNGLLYEGRVLYTDNFYTSVPLAEELLNNSTYICGTVKAARKYLPGEAKTKQKRSDCFCSENRQGVKF